MTFIKEHLLTIFLILTSGIYRFWSFYQVKFANGWDSYFYLIQVKSYLEEGTMHSSDLSLIYPIMLVIQYFTSNYELTFKVTASLLSLAFTYSAFWMVKGWSKSIWLSLLAIAWLVFSPHLTYFASQYPKNLLGLIFFCGLLAVISKVDFQTKTSLKDWLLIISWLLLNFFGHRLMAVLAISFLAIYWFYLKTSVKMILLLLSGFLIFLTIGILLPGLISFLDWQRFEGLLSIEPQFAPYSFFKTFGPERISNFWLAEIIFISLLLIWLISKAIFSLFTQVNMPVYPQKQVVSNRKKWAFTIASTVLCTAMIFPFLHWSLEGIAYRVFLVFMPLVAIFTLSNISLFLLPIGQKRIISGGIAILAILGFWAKDSYQPALHDPPYALYKKMSERVIAHSASKDIKLLICHKSLAEYFTFQTGIDALPWLPEYDLPEGECWRLVSNLPDFMLKKHLTEAKIVDFTRISSAYWLVPEPQWQFFLSQLANSEDAEEWIPKLNTWQNPSKIRPAYLLKNKAK